MCSLYDPSSCLDLLPDPIGDATSSFVHSVLTELANVIANGVKALVALLSAWILVPSTPVCPPAQPPGSGVAPAEWVTQCQQAASPAVQLRGYVLPITILVAVIGLLWQAIVMTVTRKGEPLLQVVRGLWNSALWGAVGIAGTQLALNASDDFATWVITTALHDSHPGPPNDGFTILIGGMLVAQLPLIPIVGILVGVVITIVLVVQIVLMIFRGAAVVILAGMLQLAASGSFTRATSPWMGKVTGWMLALIAYKPAADLVYATGLAFMSDKKHPANFVIGIAVLALSVIALPALMKFFNWTVGAMQSGNGMGMFGAGAAAGVHAASSLRGLGGNSAAEHSRYLDSHGPGQPGPASPGPSGSGNPGGPTGSGSPGGGSTPKVVDGTVTSSGPATAGTPATPATTVPAGAGATASTAGAGSAAGSGAAAGSAGAGAAGSGAAAGAGAGAAGATTAAGAGAAAATGPAAPIVLGAVVAAQAATQAAKAAGNKATDAMGGE